jgi:hypothetical protein
MKVQSKVSLCAFFACGLSLLPIVASAFTAFEFLDQSAAAKVLSADDAYVRVTADLERQAKARSAKPVSKQAYAKIMGETAKNWSAADRARIEAALPALEKFINQLVWDAPAKVHFIRADARLEDNLPHTRGTAIVLPDSAFSMPRPAFASMLAHEVFHVITRHNEAFKQQSYQQIGFEACESVRIPPQIEQLKITNPDTPLSQHTIAVTYQGRNIHALPFINFESPSIHTTTGFIDKLAVNWLIVQRVNNQCSLEGTDLSAHSVAPEYLEGLAQKIGKNTGYLFHAEEILAENFAALFMANLGGTPINAYPSPDILNSLRALWFTRK